MIVALHTTGSVTSIYLFDGAAPAQPTIEWESGRSLADELLGKIKQMVADQNKTLADIKGFIIFSGPGSFTSLRIGHTVANALADSLGVPVVGTASETWLADGIEALKTTPPGRPAVPEYGSAAHVTRPKA